MVIVMRKLLDNQWLTIEHADESQQLAVFQNGVITVTPPNHPLFFRIFHYKPTILSMGISGS